MSKTPGRNDPCPCGSQKKYKSCCWGEAQPKSNASRNSFFAKALGGSTNLKRSFTAKLIQGKTKDLIEGAFPEEIRRLQASEAPPMPSQLELPLQELPADYKPWTPASQEAKEI